MALNPTQIERIHGTISFFFDFPQDKLEELKANVKKYKDVFELKLPADSHDEEMQYLQRLIKKPTESFEPLERLNPNITEGDVVTCMTQYVSDEIAKAVGDQEIAKVLESKPPFSRPQILEALKKIFDWDEKAILEHLQQEMKIINRSMQIVKTFNRQFVSRRSTEDAPSQPAAPSLSDVIYQANARSSYSSFTINVDLKVALDEKKSVNRTIPVFGFIEDQEKAIENALQEAKKAAGEIVLQHLVTDSAKKLLTIRYYFALLNKNISLLNDIKDINPLQLQILSSSAMIFLIESGLCDIATAKRITESVIKVIENPFYYNKILNKTITVEQLAGLTIVQCLNLVSPNVIRLMELDIISLDQAQKISSAYRLLLQDEYYFNLAKKKDPLLLQLHDISLEQSKNLTTPIILYLLNNNLIKLEAVLALTLTDEIRTILNTAVIFFLVSTGKLAFDAACGLRLSQGCIYILNHDFYLNLAKKNELDFRNLATLTEKQGNDLTTVIVMFLISIKAITITDALNLDMTKAGRAICNDPFYLDLMKKTPFKLERIKNLNQPKMTLLLSPRMKTLLGNGTITIEIALKIVENPLIFHLVNKGILQIEDIKNIILTTAPTSIYQFAVRRGTPDIDQAKSVFKMALELFTEGLLTEEDLPILHNNVSEIEVPYLGLDLDDEEDHSGINNPVLDNTAIRKACLTNIFRRLDRIQESKPTLLPDGTHDDLQKIINVIEQFNLLYTGIWSTIFGARLMRLFQNQPYTLKTGTDTFEIVKTAIDDYGTEYDFLFDPGPSLASLALKELLGNLRDDLASKKNQLPELKEIHAILYYEFGEALKKEENEETEAWQIAMRSVMNYAEETLEKLTGPAPEKRARTGAFFEQKSEQNNQAAKSELKSFCTKLLQLGADLTKVNLLPAPAPVDGLGLIAASTGSESLALSANRKRKSPA